MQIQLPLYFGLFKELFLIFSCTPVKISELLIKKRRKDYGFRTVTLAISLSWQKPHNPLSTLKESLSPNLTSVIPADSKNLFSMNQCPPPSFTYTPSGSISVTSPSTVLSVFSPPYITVHIIIQCSLYVNYNRG